MSSSPWSRYTLGRLATILGNAYREDKDRERLADRAGCSNLLGHVPDGANNVQKWENLLVLCANQNMLDGYIEALDQELMGPVKDEFLKELNLASSRRFVELIGENFSKLRVAASALLDEEEDLAATLRKVKHVRQIALELHQEFDNDISWQSLTLIKISQYEIQATRNQLLAMSMNIINAADYMSVIAKPLLPGGSKSGDGGRPISLSSLGRDPNFLDEAQRWQGVIDARTYLYERTQDLYRCLKDSVSPAPKG